LEFLACPLVSSFSSAKLVLVLFVVCICCPWLLPSFSSASFLSSTVVIRVVLSPVRFFSFVYSIWIVNPYDLYGLLIRMVHMDWQSVKKSYGLIIHIHMNLMDYQSIWFDAIKSKEWKGILTTGAHDGMEECKLIMTEGRDRLSTQQEGKRGINGMGDWCGKRWCIWFLNERYFDLFTTLIRCRKNYVE